MKKGTLIRSLYFYLTCLVTLGIVVGSLISLGSLSLRTWVFPDADSPVSTLGPPPIWYAPIASDTAVAPVKEVTAPTLSCEQGCTLSESEKASLRDWSTSYSSWKQSFDNPDAQHARSAVSALSFLIVALPFFLIHFRIVQRDAQDPENETAIRPIYFYFISLGALLMVVISGGMLINVALKTWVFPSASTQDTIESRSFPAQVATDEQAAIDSISACGTACGVEQDIIDQAEAWSSDYAAWSTLNNTSPDTRQREASGALPFFIFGVPLFWYHWSMVRREAKNTPQSHTQA